MRLFIIIVLTLISFISKAQQTLIIKITGENKAPVQATIAIKGGNISYTDSTGTVSFAFPSNGKYVLVVSASGFKEKQVPLTIPYETDRFNIELEKQEEELEEVIVQSTRTSRTIANVPTRVETIELEEIDEKNNMRPANVAMLLHESTGIQVQQTSATSGNASIRIQGLDGRYTQLLKDGYANFGNFSSGLSLLEIPPLDLKQVEIIKGPASPLYGGGAIAGVVNFISKTPGVKPEYSFIFNQSNIGQTNVGGFASGRGEKTGYTMLALYNRANAFDVDDDEFTEVPLSHEITLHPKFFIYPGKNTTITLGNSFTSGERTGGDIVVIRGKADSLHQYFEKNKTIRNISSFELDRRTGDKRFLVKQSFSVFDRTIQIPDYSFSGIDYNSYTDISLVYNRPRYTFVAGGNLIYNKFNETSSNNRDQAGRTAGLYGQHTWDATENIKLESGLRLDMVNYKNALFSNTEFFVLPRISLLAKYGPKWSSRMGAGIGYKTPTLFTEETESMQYQNVYLLNQVHCEKSYGGTADVNFRTNISPDLNLSFNHMFFYTWIRHPLVLEQDFANNYRFVNADQPVQSAGFETNAKLIFKDYFKLFLGYTFTHTKARYLAGNQFLPLVPRNKLNSALIYEKEDFIKMGLEGYFTGSQHLSNGTTSPAYSEFGFMVEKIFDKFSVYVNFENFTDTRQSRYKDVVNGTHPQPTFDEIWTHTEGFIFNGGIKLKF